LVEIYSGGNFNGRISRFGLGYYETLPSDASGEVTPGTASSMKIPEGVQVALFSEPNFEGTYTTLRGPKDLKLAELHSQFGNDLLKSLWVKVNNKSDAAALYPSEEVRLQNLAIAQQKLAAGGLSSGMKQVLLKEVQQMEEVKLTINDALQSDSKESGFLKPKHNANLNAMEIASDEEALAMEADADEQAEFDDAAAAMLVADEYDEDVERVGPHASSAWSSQHQGAFALLSVFVAFLLF
jgi:hypothetical protein